MTIVQLYKYFAFFNTNLYIYLGYLKHSFDSQTANKELPK